MRKLLNAIDGKKSNSALILFILFSIANFIGIKEAEIGGMAGQLSIEAGTLLGTIGLGHKIWKKFIGKK